MVGVTLRRYGWIAPLLLVAIAASVLARTANALVVDWLAPTPTAIIASAASNRTKVERLARDRDRHGRDEQALRGKQSAPDDLLAALLQRNIFRAARSDTLRPHSMPPLEDLTNSSGIAQPDEAGCALAMSPFPFLGTIVARNAELSTAVFRIDADRDVRILRSGEQLVDGYIIRSVARRSVRVDHDDRCEVFTLGEEQANQPASIRRNNRAESETETRTNPNIKTLRQRSPGEYEIEQDEAYTILSNMSSLARDGRIVPSFENGKPNGFKLLAIRSQGLYSLLGLKNGDVIQRVNGYAIDSPDAAFEAYAHIKDAGSVAIAFRRDGQPRHLILSFR